MSSRRTTLIAFITTTTAALLAGCGAEDPSLSRQAEDGRAIAREAGCANCHGADFSGGSGPSWRGIYGEQVTLENGTTVTVDDDYIRTSILDPGAQIVDGYPASMPGFRDKLSDEEIEAIIAYIAALGPNS